jgi:uncharacterized protein
MNCPVCKSGMVEEDFGGVKVDVCMNGCKGIWFDWGELKKLDERNEGLGEALQNALKYPRVNDVSRGVISCPKCNLPMHRHVYESDKDVNVDECFKCGGFFLDSGELREIRDHHMSEQERAAYLQRLINNLPSYQQHKQDSEKLELRTNALEHFTQFLRASYYLTGKQPNTLQPMPLAGRG